MRVLCAIYAPLVFYLSIILTKLKVWDTRQVANEQLRRTYAVFVRREEGADLDF